MKVYLEVESNNPSLRPEHRRMLEDFLFTCIAKMRYQIKEELNKMVDNRKIYKFFYLEGDNNIDKVIIQLTPVNVGMMLYRETIGIMQ